MDVSAAALTLAACNQQQGSEAVDKAQDAVSEPVGQTSAADFDKTYIDQQVAAHEGAVTLHRGFSDKTDVPALAEHARTVLPKIEAHLERAKQLQSSLGG